MRISDKFMQKSLVNGVQQGLENLTKASAVVSSGGKRITKLTDDAVGSSKIIAMRSDLRDVEQYTKNIESAKSQLSMTESQLDTINSIILKAKSLALQSQNGTVTADLKKSLASQVRDLRTQLVTAGNTKYNDTYLFGGFKNTAAPFDATTGAYNGDEGAIVKRVGTGGFGITANLNGKEVFNGTVDVLKAMQDLEDGLNAQDTGKVNTQIANLQSAYDNVLGCRTKVGSRLIQIDLASKQVASVQDVSEDAISKIEDVDIVKATIDLMSAQNTYKAALSASTDMFKYSLMDFMK